MRKGQMFHDWLLEYEESVYEYLLYKDIMKIARNWGVVLQFDEIDFIVSDYLEHYKPPAPYLESRDRILGRYITRIMAKR